MNKRVQNVKPVVGKKKRYAIAIISSILIWVSIFIIARAAIDKYSPPKFAKDAIMQEPVVDEGYMYGQIPCQFGYAINMAANLYQQEDGSVKVYFYNSPSNDVNLQCKIKKKDTGKVLYKSDVVKPGYYIESINPKRKLKNEAMEVIVEVMAYEPSTWYSKGSTEVELVLQPW